MATSNINLVLQRSEESVESRDTNDDFLQPLLNGLGMDVRGIFEDRAVRSSFPCRCCMSRSVRQAHKSCSTGVW